MKYYINGFPYGRNYFLSFGFTKEEYERMLNGDVILKNNNAFWIVIEGE